MNPELNEHLRNYEFNDDSLAICLLHYKKDFKVELYQMGLLEHYLQEKKKAVHKESYSKKIRLLLQRIGRDTIIEHIKKKSEQPGDTDAKGFF